MSNCANYPGCMFIMDIDGDTLVPRDLPTPTPGPGQVLIEVAGAGVNRADLLQMKGLHPPPPGAPAWPGLEVSGVIQAVGDGVDPALIGTRAMALIDGGGYASHALAFAADLLPVPDSVDLTHAGGLPEALATMFTNFVDSAGLDPRENNGKTVLVHGGSGGVGTTSIQWLRATGAVVFATAGGPERAERCNELGAFGIDYREEDFVEVVRSATGDRGADVILDVVGAAYLQRNIEALATWGHLAIIGMQKGTKAEINLGPLLYRRLSISGTVLRSRTREEKAAIIAGVNSHVMPLVERREVRPIIHEEIPLAQASDAHAAMAAGEIFGKVVLTP